MLGRVKLQMDVLFDVGWEYLLIRVRFGEIKRFKRVVIWRIMVLMLCLSYDRMFIYDFILFNIFKIGFINFVDFCGKVVLVVNVVIYCDYILQFLGLNVFQKEFGVDFQIIGVFIDQFYYVSICILYLYYVYILKREIRYLFIYICL